MLSTFAFLKWTWNWSSSGLNHFDFDKRNIFIDKQQYLPGEPWTPVEKLEFAKPPKPPLMDEWMEQKAVEFFQTDGCLKIKPR